MTKKTDRIYHKASLMPRKLFNSQSVSWWKKGLLVSLVFVTGVAIAGKIIGHKLIEERLIPLIETELTKYLYRPIKIGGLRNFTLNSASFGQSYLPATETNPDTLEASKIKVNFNLIPFIFTKTLPLRITLEKPNVFIEQDQKGIWTPTKFGTGEKQEGGIKVDVKSISLKRGKLTLVGRNSQTKELNAAVQANFKKGVVNFLNNGDLVQFKVNKGNLLKGGKLDVSGEVVGSIIDLDIIGKSLAANEIENLLSLPIGFESGTVDGDLAVKITRDPTPELHGRAKLKSVDMQVPGLTRSFSDSKGQIRFDKHEIYFDRVKTNFGEVPGKIKGSVNIAGKGNYDIEAETNPVEADLVLEAFELESPAKIKGKIKGDVELTGLLENPVTQFKIATTTPAKINNTDFKKVVSDIRLVGNDLTIKSFEGLPLSGGKIKGNGRIELAGAQNVLLKVAAQNLASKKIAQDYQTKLPIDMGKLTGDVVISAQANDADSWRVVDGKGNFALGKGLVDFRNLRYAGEVWRSQIKATKVRFDSLPFGKDTTDTISAALIDGTWQATGEINDPKLDTLVAEGSAVMSTVGGIVISPKIKVTDGIWQGNFRTSDLQLRQLFPEVPTEFNDQLRGNFYLAGEVTTPPGVPSTIAGRGDLKLANGTLNVPTLTVVGNDWQADAVAEDLELKQLSSTTPDQFAGLVNGAFKVSGTIDNITPEGIIAKGDGSLTLIEGTFDAQNLAIKNGNFTTKIIPQGVDLALFADPNSDDFILEGFLGGELQASGQVEKIDPTAIKAKGNVSFSQGIDLLEQPFAAEIDWDGSNLKVLQASGDGLNAKGNIKLDETFFDNIPDKLAAVDYFSFDVAQANGININRLKLTLPSWATNLDRSGLADFSGRISGIPSQMDIAGDLNLRNFVVENIGFLPNLNGRVQVAPDFGVDLDLASKESNSQTGQSQEQIALKLDAEFLPKSFAVRHSDFSVVGKGQQEIIEVEAANFPLELLKAIAIKSPDLELPDNFAVQPVSGNISGEFTSNLNTLATSGDNVVITSPLLGKIKGNKAEGSFQYAENYLALQDFQFQQGDSKYELTGDVIQKDDDIDLNGVLSINQGNIQDILVAFEIFELTDFGKGFGDRTYAKSADLYAASGRSDPQKSTQDQSENSSENSPPQNSLFGVGTDNTPVWNQLTQLAEIEAWLGYNEKKRQESSILPDLKNLRGGFNGDIVINGSLKNSLTANFSLEGTQWQWATKSEARRRSTNSQASVLAEKITLRGDFRDGVLTILPLVIDLPTITDSSNLEGTTKKPEIIVSGTFGGEQASGKLFLNSIPIDLIEKVFPLPPEVDFDGILSATANISGKTANPQARGEISIANAQINETEILSTSGSFGYDDARLNFSGNSIVAKDSQPLTLTGSVPYQMPFATVTPDSDRLEISLNVQDKALTLLNIFSKGEVNWIDGTGAVALDIFGNFNQNTNYPSNISTKGTAFVRDGKIAVKTLPDDFLTGVNTDITFDFDRISVDNFLGNFGGGKVSAQGTIPIDKETPQENPLTIDFQDLIVDLKGLYKGGFKGQLQILGQAIEPDITGDISLFDGTITLSEDTDAVSSVPLTPETQQRIGLPAVTEYKNLKLNLGDNILISQPPIFNFLANGTLNVGGTFLEPLPSGTINLERGQVNLFTTQLNLVRGEKNTARFSPNNTLDPFLDVSLVGSAIESTQNRTPEDPLSTEIEDVPASRFGTLETVRVSADVRGLSSQITNNIQLTSSPPRSQTEILALLGGNFVSTLGAGGDSTVGLAGLAGSALLGSFNSQFNNFFPGEFRLFPTQIIDEDRERERIDAIAGEVAIDITDNFSFSALKILNIEEIPAQFGFRYRLNENFVLRGSSNFEDDTRGVVEYELRF